MGTDLGICGFLRKGFAVKSSQDSILQPRYLDLKDGIKKLIPFFIPHWRKAAAGTVFIFIVSACGLAQPL
ncbi:MAG: hypothetical protein L0Y62_00340, partial [Nitrospirae bacterium]|nr:hypothetical protein [Nitrospirota bacterium]